MSASVMVGIAFPAFQSNDAQVQFKSSSVSDLQQNIDCSLESPFSLHLGYEWQQLLIQQMCIFNKLSSTVK